MNQEEFDKVVAKLNRIKESTTDPRIIKQCDDDLVKFQAMLVPGTTEQHPSQQLENTIDTGDHDDEDHN